MSNVDVMHISNVDNMLLKLPRMAGLLLVVFLDADMSKRMGFMDPLRGCVSVRVTKHEASFIQYSQEPSLTISMV